MNNRILVLAPHGDDEALGLGGTIVKHTQQGDHVTVAFLKRGYDERTEQQAQNTHACKNILKYENIIHLNLDAQIIASDITTLIKELDSLFDNVNPHTVYTTHMGDLHQDHRALFSATNSAVRYRDNLNIKRVFSYEIPSSTDQGLMKSYFPFIPNYYNVLTEDQILQKIKGYQWYYTETRSNPLHLRNENALIEHAKKRGRECNSLYAEAFNCLRYICD